MSPKASTLSERIRNYFEPVRHTQREREDILDEPSKCLCPADEQPKEPYPVGFFKALTRSGLDGGLGFYCDRCHLLIQCGLEPEVSFQHCKKTESTPRANARMETHQVGFYRR
jgi:hypothetical protein